MSTSSMRSIIQTIAAKSPECRPECEQLAQLIGIRLAPYRRGEGEGEGQEGGDRSPTLRICTVGGESFEVDDVTAKTTIARLKRLIGEQKEIKNPQRHIELFVEGSEDPLPKDRTLDGATTLFMCVTEPHPDAPTDRAVLEEIFRANRGDTWPDQKKDGWTSCDDVSLWAHVTADSDGNVRKLSFEEGYGDGFVTHVPDSIGKLALLEEISFNGCKSLKTIPASFGHLMNLRCLDLRCSGITHLPNELGDCPRLREMRLTYCASLKSTVSLKAVMKKKRPTCDVWWPN